jgi:hypothetical protein
LANQWSQPLGVLTYLLARIIENDDSDKKERGINCIEALYNIVDTMYIDIQEIDYNFVFTLLKTTRQPGLSLEEELVELHTTMMRHDYSRTIRY